MQTLTQTAQRIRDCVGDVDEVQLTMPPAPKEWSAVEILAHLRACAEVWSYSIYAMYTLDQPELAHIHPRKWAKAMRYDRLSFAENLQVFEVERNKLLRLLNRLSLNDWGRTCRFRGRQNTFTIFVQVHRMATHEDQHCQQIAAIFT